MVRMVGEREEAAPGSEVTAAPPLCGKGIRGIPRIGYLGDRII